MKPKSPWHHKRWTLRVFEWGVLACIVLALMTVFLRKVRHLQAEAERLNVQATVENLRAAVLLAGILGKDRSSERGMVRAGGNPVLLLKEETGLELSGYLGEMAAVDPGQIEPGHWYYDRSQGALIYRLINTDGFESSLTGPVRVRFCLRDAAEGKIDGVPVRLEACEAYRWEKKK